MGLINISDIQSDMILASPVFGPQGVMLLREGTRITDKHIFLFKTWGVLEVDIEGMDKKGIIEANGSSTEGLNRLQKGLEQRFEGVLDNEIMAEILRVAKKHLAVKSFLSAGDD